MGFGSMHIKSVKTKRKFTIDEIYEILKAEGRLPAEPYISGTGMTRGLFVPGVGKYDVCISTMGAKITCSENVRKSEQVKTIGLSVLSSGWSDAADRESVANKAMTDAVAADIERLFADRD